MLQFTEATKGPNGEPGVVIVHVEACTHIHRSLSNIRAMGGSPSVALNPSTPAEAVENILDLVDHVLVMTVNPGFGGQAYIPTMTDKIEKIRQWIVDRNLDVDIEVDGGIKATPETIGACAAAGANCFIAGSGLFAYDDGVCRASKGSRPSPRCTRRSDWRVRACLLEIHRFLISHHTATKVPTVVNVRDAGHLSPR